MAQSTQCGLQPRTELGYDPQQVGLTEWKSVRTAQGWSGSERVIRSAVGRARRARTFANGAVRCGDGNQERGRGGGMGWGSGSERSG